MFSVEESNAILDFAIATSHPHYDCDTIMENINEMLKILGYSVENPSIWHQWFTLLSQRIDIHTLQREREAFAKYRWRLVYQYLVKMRPIALVIFEEWQKRVCAPGKTGFLNDRKKFRDDCSVLT